MTTWYIERIPAAGGASDTRTLADWGVDGGTFIEAAWAIGNVSISIPSNDAGSTSPAWGHLDHLILWAGNPAAGGTRRQHLWVLLPGHNAEVQSEAHQYTLVGPWYWLEVTQFFYPLTISDITTDPETGAATGCTWHMRHGTEVVWTSWAAQSSGTVQGQIHRALWCAIDNDAPIAIGAIDIAGLAPVADQDGMTCADVVARAARYSPRASQWWDNSGETPIFRAASYANRPTAAIALGPTSKAWDIAPRHDLRIDVVRVGYQYDNDGATAAWYDTVGDDTLKDGAHTLRSLVDCPSSAIASNAASHFGIASQLYTALHSTPYTGGASWPDWGSGLPAVHTGHALNLTGALAEWATMLAPIASVTLTISAEAEDELSVSLGLPDSLGANDLFQLFTFSSRLGNGALATTGGTSDPTPPGTPVPGTIGDLNGGTGAYSPIGSIEIETMGGTATLCGLGEMSWGGVSYISTPPRKYRRLTGSGITAVVCSADGCSTDWQVTGATQYSSTDCSLLSTLQGWSRGNLVGDTDGYPVAGIWPCGGGYGYIAICSLVTSATTREVWFGSAADDCDQVPPPGALCSAPTGRVMLTLSDEDTEDDAIARVYDAATWSTGATTAIWEPRTSGFSYDRRKMRWRVSHTEEGTKIAGFAGLRPFWAYTLRVTWEQRPVSPVGDPTGEWEDAGTTEYPFIASIDGTGGPDWIEREAARGYELRMASSDLSSE